MSWYSMTIDSGQQKITQNFYVIHDEPGAAREHGVTEIYLNEVRRQSLFALRALADLRLTVKRFTHEDDSLAVWYHAQSFVVAAAGVSKLLAPGKVQVPRRDPSGGIIPKQRRAAFQKLAQKRAEKRAETLRSCLDIQNDSPLLDRKVRNAVEHFDERLDWATMEGAPPVVVDADVVRGPMVMFCEDEARQQPCLPMRLLDADAGVLSFQYDVIDLVALEAELERLLLAAEAALAKPGPVGKTAVGIFPVICQRLDLRRVDDGGASHGWLGLSRIPDFYIDANSSSPHVPPPPPDWPQGRHWERQTVGVQQTIRIHQGEKPSDVALSELD